MASSDQLLTTPQLVRAAAERFADADALVDDLGDGLVDGGRAASRTIRWSFRELAGHVEHAGRAFATAGLAPGDRVAIWAPNIHEWVVAALGAHMAGGVLVPLNTRFKGAEAADIIGRSRARVLLCVNEFLGTDYVAALRGADAKLPHLDHVVVLRGAAPEGTTSWPDFLAAADGEAPLPEVGPDALSDIIFTSGTTGRPKGVMTTHAQTVRVFIDWSGIVGLTHDDRYLVVNPFFHTFGYKAGIVACLVRGATIVPQAVFDVPAVLRRVAAERITMLPGPPTLYLMILDHPDRHAVDLSSLRLAVTGAAAVPVEMIRRMREELTFRTIVTGYGLTESTGTVTMCRPDDSPETISTTSGRAIHDVEVRVVDDANREVSRGTPGEVVCRGYNVMLGYFEDPEATAAAIDPDGWLHTGDVGVMDEHGNIRITDRKKDMFIVGGFNAYPAEIENTLLGHPGVAQVAVVGVPDERLGEVGHAFVVPRSGHALDAEALLAWARQRLANYKVPRAVHVVDALPTNASGKVLKFELRGRARR
jgi:acyl-CoA synthetase (AMP-forming)/AMP-acid ligase II